MSYSFEGTFRTRSDAHKKVVNQDGVPDEVRALVLDAIDHLPIDTGNRYIYVKFCGHQCEGIGSYDRSNCDMVVQPMYFSE